MKFVSLFSAVSLERDPEFGDYGDIYFNTASLSYRVKGLEQWIDLLDQKNHILYTGNQSVIFGDEETGDFSATLDETFDNHTIYSFSSSTSFFYIAPYSIHPYRKGSIIKIINSGDGRISIRPLLESVDIITPSESYLTFKGDHIDIVNVDTDKWVLSGPFRDIY